MKPELQKRKIELQEREIDLQKQDIDLQEAYIDLQERDIDLQKRDIDLQNREIDLQKQDIDLQEWKIELQEREIDLQERKKRKMKYGIPVTGVINRIIRYIKTFFVPERNGLEKPANERSYFLNHKIRNMDYEINMNNFQVANSRDHGHPSGLHNIDEFILPGKAQKVRIRIMPAQHSQKEITPEMIKEINKNPGIHLLENRDYGNIKVITALTLPHINENRPHYEHEWNFEFK